MHCSESFEVLLLSAELWDGSGWLFIVVLRLKIVSKGSLGYNLEYSGLKIVSKDPLDTILSTLVSRLYPRIPWIHAILRLEYYNQRLKLLYLHKGWIMAQSVYSTYIMSVAI